MHTDSLTGRILHDDHHSGKNHKVQFGLFDFIGKSAKSGPIKWNVGTIKWFPDAVLGP